MSWMIWDKKNVWVLEDFANEAKTSSSVACQVGVESTVAKLEAAKSINSQYSYSLTVLRQGAISVQDLQACLTKSGRNDVSVASLSSRTVEETQATVAPGQTIKHYSPRIPSFLLAPSLTKLDKVEQFLKNAIVLDFGGRLASLKSVARQYRDLSISGNSTQAAQCVFEALRWAEQVDPDAQLIVFPQVVPVDSLQEAQDALTLALHDRLTRAASGIVLDSLESMKAQIQPL